MSDKAAAIRSYPFSINDFQLEKLIWRVNEAFCNRRGAISSDRNVNPYSNYPIRPERHQLYVPKINNENGSVYVQNIQIDISVINLYLNACLPTLVSIRKGVGEIELESQRLDDVRVANGELRRRTFEGPLTTLQWYDEFVARELAEVFVAITGQKPTMGGYKRPSENSVQAGHPAPEIKSPFTVFALYLIEIAKIKRLGAGEFTVGVLRKAMAPYWRSKRMAEGSESIEGAEEAEFEVLVCSAAAELPKTQKRRGRPKRGHELAPLRDETPLQMDICSAAELRAMDLEEFDVD